MNSCRYDVHDSENDRPCLVLSSSSKKAISVGSLDCAGVSLCDSLLKSPSSKRAISKHLGLLAPPTR